MHCTVVLFVWSAANLAVAVHLLDRERAENGAQVALKCLQRRDWVGVGVRKKETHAQCTSPHLSSITNLQDGVLHLLARLAQELLKSLVQELVALGMLALGRIRRHVIGGHDL